MTPKPDPKRPESASAKITKKARRHDLEVQKAAKQSTAAGDDREAQLRHLTEQCLELMDQVVEARRERDQMQSRCAEMEDLLAKTRVDSEVSRDRLAWLEDLLAQAQRTSAGIQADELEDLKQESVAATESRDKLGADADLDQRFENLGEGLDLEHRIKAALMNMVKQLSGVEACNRELESRVLELEEQVSATEQLQQKLDAVQGEAAAARRELIDLAAKSGASMEDRKRIRAELEQERSSREAVEAAMAKLRGDENTIRELSAIVGLSESAPQALVDEVRHLRSTVDDRDRWVTALLSELSNRRMKLSRRGLMEHERKFLEGRDRAKGS